MAQLFQVWKSTCTFVVDNQTFIACITDLDWFWMWIHVLFSKKNVDKRTDGRMNRHTDWRATGDGRTDKQTSSINKQELCYNSAKKTYEINCQNDTCLFWNKHLLRYILAYILCILVSGTYNQDEQLKYIYKGALQILGNIFLKTTIMNFINFGLKHKRNA